MRRTVTLACLLLAAALPAVGAEERPAYPPTKVVAHRQHLHGQNFNDSYRWLEDDDDKEVIAWDDAQRQLVRTRLDPFARRQELGAALRAEFDLGGMKSLPRFAGGMRWFSYRPKGAQHPILYRTDPTGAQAPQPMLDPRHWANDGSQRVGSWTISPDGRYLAYLRIIRGELGATLNILDLTNGSYLPEFVERARDAGVVWLPDSSGFFYSRYPDKGSVPFGETEYHPRLYLHRLGALVIDDTLVYGRGRPREETFDIGRSSDGARIFLHRQVPWKATEVFELAWADDALTLTPRIALPAEEAAEGGKAGAAAAGAPGGAPGEEVEELVEEEEETPSVPTSGAAGGGEASDAEAEGEAQEPRRPERVRVDAVGDTYVLLSDRGDGRRAVYLARAGKDGGFDEPRLVPFPRGEQGVVRDVRVVGGRHLLAHVQIDLVSSLHVVDLDAPDTVRSVPLPGDGSVGSSITTVPGESEAWFMFQSHARPPTAYRVDLAAKEPAPEAVGSLPTTVDPDGLTSTRAMYESRDGTKVPIFLLHRKDVTPDGTQAVLLTGYGALGKGQTAAYDRVRALFADLGGVVAVACLRGGDEFGEAWHDAGRREHKMHAVEDLIAAADWLVETKRASRARLGIVAEDHGALVATVALNMRPDLCGAVALHAPLVDMLRYHEFPGTGGWVREYGSPDEAVEFGWLRSYAPLQNIRPAQAYPSVLVTTGLNEPGIPALHARKLVANWQQGSISLLPILLLVDRPKEGQPAPGGIDARISRTLDAWSFLLMELDAS